MNIVRKDATITNTGKDDEFPGTFEVILSAPTLDRDGDTLLPEQWKQPLPEHITFDQDHLMSVAGTVGSGTPRIDEKSGALIVSGTYSSLDRAQEVRTLVNEGHIRTTSVAFMTTKTQKDGKATMQRELLNGAFVAIPSNREALVLSSKGLKAGARNSAQDAEKIQGIHDTAAALGADCTAAKSFQSETRFKAVAGSYEQNQQALCDALSALYPDDNAWAYPSATFDDSVVFHVYGGPDAGQWQASYSLNADGTATIGTPARVNLVEQIIPAKRFTRKDADTEDASNPAALISAVDAAIDQAIDLLADVDPTSLPAEVAQAIALIQAADATVDELLDVLGIPDPDEDAAAPGAAPDPAAGAPAPAAGSKAAPVADERSNDMSTRAARLRMFQNLTAIS